MESNRSVSSVLAIFILFNGDLLNIVFDSLLELSIIITIKLINIVLLGVVYMFKFLFLLLILPLTELYVIIEVGSSIGSFSVILLIIMTAIIGISFMRNNGMGALKKFQQGMAQGKVSDDDIFTSVVIFIGGLFLLLPGFITDTIGLLFLIPPTRQLLVNLLLRNSKFSGSARQTNQRGNVYEAQWQETQRPPSRIHQHNQEDIIEGEVIEPNAKPKD